MSTQPVTLFFDVNETLSDLSTVADAFEHVGAQRSLAATWFAAVLRDGFALTIAGSPAVFVDIAASAARQQLQAARIDGDVDEAADAVMAAFSSVGLHPDVAPGLRALRVSGHRLFTLSNGPASTAERLLGGEGVRDLVNDVLSVEGHSPWKPHRTAYLDALARTATRGTAYLVAVHPWDIHGAAEAGLQTAWIDRDGAEYPSHFRQPTTTASSILDLAEQLRPSSSADRRR